MYKDFKKKFNKEFQLPKANTGVAKSFLLMIFVINILVLLLNFVLSTLFSKGSRLPIFNTEIPDHQN